MDLVHCRDAGAPDDGHRASLQGDSMPKMLVTVYHPVECRLLEPKPKTEGALEFSQTHAEFWETDFVSLCDGRHYFRVTRRVSRKNIEINIDPYSEGIYLENYVQSSSD